MSSKRNLTTVMQRSVTMSSDGSSLKLTPVAELSLGQRLDKWMVNEGASRLTYGVFILLHALVFSFGMMNYSVKDNLTTARATFGPTYAIARSAALVLHVDVALILLPVCRNLISLARRTPLNGVIPFDANIEFHKAVAWSIVFFSLVHTFAHFVNFGRLAASANLGVKGWLLANFRTGPGASGWVMLISLGIMVWYAVEKQRRKPNGGYDRFWSTHHLFIVFFGAWSIHGAFCMIKPDRPPFCAQIGVFWKYWLVGGVIYGLERAAREWRGTHRTYISKVIQHPSRVCEIQIKKENVNSRAGQYIFLCCPEISLVQYHPFTLTSAPEEEFISVHIRCVGDFTTMLARRLGCDFDNKTKKEEGGARGDIRGDPRASRLVGLDTSQPSQSMDDPALHRVLPRVMIDGPFGSASEDVFKYEVAMLVGAGIGVTPFASILKSIWYRVGGLGKKGRGRLAKVYFFWVIRDFGSLEWFRSLLLAIEAQDIGHLIEIHTYLTLKIKPDDAQNIMIQDAGATVDAITGLRSPTNFGRPDWDRVFESVRSLHPATDVGVFFCGPEVLSKTLHNKCNEWSEPGKDGTRFVYGKENF
ncbi:hypothetical protein G7K_5912-t1 [Saitoella complicata NRRL Y-17804]|uniref:FAD-binding FR-type domain-containing protein n=1 Tax=Saitoella complicata (strain BCRC 22490 / CBS 7301 / JCM 7358 / NBRC 10748 / NRRL Y-17804) TaxID=698492 RepID=A0A0E9NQ49_SAICN|nr:hypothetical protein G7K_5912-t1 [Saitoella complicata NRRL Y-17804]